MIVVLCVALGVSGCATYGQTEPVVFCCSGYDTPQYESVAFLGIDSGKEKSRFVVPHKPGDDVAMHKPVLHREPEVEAAMQQPIADHEPDVNAVTQRPIVEQDVGPDATYQTDLSECSRVTAPQVSGWIRIGRTVTGAIGGALGGIWIGGHAGLHGMALGSLAGLVAGGAAGYAISEDGDQAAAQHAVTQCMAERGHRVTGVNDR